MHAYVPWMHIFGYRAACCHAATTYWWCHLLDRICSQESRAAPHTRTQHRIRIVRPDFTRFYIMPWWKPFDSAASRTFHASPEPICGYTIPPYTSWNAILRVRLIFIGRFSECFANCVWIILLRMQWMCAELAVTWMIHHWQFISEYGYQYILPVELSLRSVRYLARKWCPFV